MLEKLTKTKQLWKAITHVLKVTFYAFASMVIAGRNINFKPSLCFLKARLKNAERVRDNTFLVFSVTLLKKRLLFYLKSCIYIQSFTI